MMKILIIVGICAASVILMIFENAFCPITVDEAGKSLWEIGYTAPRMYYRIPFLVLMIIMFTVGYIHVDKKTKELTDIPL